MRTIPLAATVGAAAFALTVTLLVRSKADFAPPDEKRRVRAIGPIGELPLSMQLVFLNGPDFEPIAKPGPSDWLATQKEAGQTYEQFIRTARNRPDETRDTIYLQPLGTFDAVEGYPSIEQMTEYTRAFYAMKVELLPMQPMGKVAATSRMNNGKQQWLTRDILKSLSENVPADAFCVLAVTMHDLYPDPTWNYVFGMASLRDRVGVFSFARHDPAFSLGKRRAGWETLMLERNCKVLAHEIGHMFGIRHCIYFQCLMNGSNHLRESDSKPLHLCPCCLRKLHDSVKFELVERYVKIRKFLTDNKLKSESDWITKRMARLDSRSF